MCRALPDSFAVRPATSAAERADDAVPFHTPDVGGEGSGAALHPGRNAGRRGTRLKSIDTLPGPRAGGVTRVSPSTSPRGGATSVVTSAATPVSVDGCGNDVTTGERTAGSPGIAATPGIAGSETTGTGTGKGRVAGGSDVAGVEAPCGTETPALTANATFAWLTGPSLPGLAIRIDTLTLLG